MANFLDLSLNIALLVALAAIFQVIESRWHMSRLISQFTYGVLFGAVGLVDMLRPIHFLPGIIFDGRSIILSVGGFFGGPVVALIAAFMCGGYRLLLGGSGAAMGVSVIAESAALGVAFYYWRRGGATRHVGLVQLWAFGLLVHCIMLGLVILLPGGARQAVWQQLGFAIIGVYPLATTLICLLFLDYEKQRHSRTVIEESEARFRILFEQANDGMLLVNLETKRFMLSNRQIQKMLGYRDVELQQMTVPDIHPSADLPAVLNQFEKQARGELAMASGIPVQRKDGTLFYADINAAKIRLQQQNCLLCIFHDITERNRTEQRITDALNFNQAVFRASPVGIAVYKAAGPCVSANQATAQIIGGSLEDVLKLNFRQMESWKRSGLLDAAEAVLATQTERQLEIHELTTFGRKVWCNFRLVPFAYTGEPHLLVLVNDITERKQMENLLRESESQFKGFFEQSNVGKSITQFSGEVRVNQAFCDMLGYSKEELQHKTWQAITHPDDIPPTQEAVDLLRSGKQDSTRLVKRFLHKNGSVVWTDLSTKLRRDEEGQPSYFMTTIIDITERKRTEEQFRESERNYREIFNATSDAIFVHEQSSGRLVDVNESVMKMYGYANKEEVLAGAPEQMNSDRPPYTIVEARNLLRKAVDEGPQIFEWLARKKTGEVFWVEVALRCANIGGNRRILAVARDITERKQAAKELREQAALLDAANDGIYVCALDHTLTYWNIGAERLYGWSQAEALGRKISELGNLDHENFAEAHEMVLAQGHWSGELKKTDKDGKEHVVFCRWTLLRDEQNLPAKVLSITTDVTEHKQLENQFLRAQRMEGIGLLAGGIAHDLNNILSPILMSSSILRDAIDDPDSRQMIDTIEACAQRGSDIIKQLLTFARGKPGVRTPLPIRHFLNEMDKLICETFPRNITSSVHAPKDIWPILGDATQIHQALMNLCVNARDAMPNGGTLTLAAANETIDKPFSGMPQDAPLGRYVWVSVADTGIGIHSEHLDRIFDPFFTTKEIGEGTGLGLATVLGIMRGHGGFVLVSSNVGQGTTFKLYFPASSEVKAAVPVSHELRAQGHGELILVVDDESSVRNVVQRTLEMYGYKVIAAREGNEALDLFSTHRAEIKAVLTDMMMPNMDGPKLIQALRQLDARLPILGMTGLAEQADVKALEDLNLPELLIKPFTVMKLLAALHETLAKPD